MKSILKKLSLQFVLITAWSLILAAYQSRAQTFTNLHNFTPVGAGANSSASLILSGDRLFGTASGGGNGGNGEVFALNIDGTLYTNLHSFAFSDGINPFAGLVLAGGALYGTASQGGSAGNGAVFAINTDGTGFTNLHSFSGGGDGANPYAGLVASDGMLYGTVSGGGTGNGTVFAIGTNGSGFMNLHTFSGGGDGAAPYGGLVLSGNTLYGTASGGGSAGNGVVFAVNTDTTGFTNLHSFSGGSDGATPHTGMILSGDTLYGAATSGGSAGNGTLFAINTDGVGYTNLHSLTSASDGANPNAMILSGNTLYGTASHGGASGSGTLFAINMDGTAFTNLYNFTTNPSPNKTNIDGVLPRAGLVLSGATLYGTAYQGGSSDNGTVFAFTLGNSTSAPPAPIPLTIEWSDGAVVLSWTNSAFALQSAPALTSTFTNLPGATSRYTNPISGARQFFRLMAN